MEALRRITGLSERRADRLLVEGLRVEELRPRPLTPPLGVAPRLKRRRVDRRGVVLAWLGHPLERVVEVDVAIARPELLEGQDHREHRAAAPDAALGECTRDPRA